MFQKRTHTAKTTEEKLDAIVEHLSRLDRRDRLRTWGGFFRSIIPLAVMLGSIWYVYTHGDALLRKVTEESAKQASIMIESGTDKMLKQFLPK